VSEIENRKGAMIDAWASAWLALLAAHRANDGSNVEGDVGGANIPLGALPTAAAPTERTARPSARERSVNCSFHR